MSHRFVKLTNMYKLNKILLKLWVKEEVKAYQSKHGNTVGQNDQIQPESEAHSTKLHREKKALKHTSSSCGSRNEKRNK